MGWNRIWIISNRWWIKSNFDRIYYYNCQRKNSFISCSNWCSFEWISRIFLSFSFFQILWKKKKRNDNNFFFFFKLKKRSHIFANKPPQPIVSKSKTTFMNLDALEVARQVFIYLFFLKKLKLKFNSILFIFL